MTTISHKPVPCYSCGELNDKASGVDHNEAPSEGDISLCMYCAALSRYDRVDGEILPVAMTAEEFNALSSAERAQLEELQRTVREFHARRAR